MATSYQTEDRTEERKSPEFALPNKSVSCSQEEWTNQGQSLVTYPSGTAHLSWGKAGHSQERGQASVAEVTSSWKHNPGLEGKSLPTPVSLVFSLMVALSGLGRGPTLVKAVPPPPQLLCGSSWFHSRLLASTQEGFEQVRTVQLLPKAPPYSPG